MKKSNLKIQKSLTEEAKERLLGGNVFSIDFLFDGDYAAKNPETRKNWPVIDAEKWQQQQAPSPGNFMKAMEAV